MSPRLITVHTGICESSTQSEESEHTRPDWSMRTRGNGDINIGLLQHTTNNSTARAMESYNNTALNSPHHSAERTQHHRLQACRAASERSRARPEASMDAAMLALERMWMLRHGHGCRREMLARTITQRGRASPHETHHHRDTRCPSTHARASRDRASERTRALSERSGASCAALAPLRLTEERQEEEHEQLRARRTGHSHFAHLYHGKC